MDVVSIFLLSKVLLLIIGFCTRRKELEERGTTNQEEGITHEMINQDPHISKLNMTI
jgi:hypothetical protein